MTEKEQVISSEAMEALSTIAENGGDVSWPSVFANTGDMGLHVIPQDQGGWEVGVKLDGLARVVGVSGEGAVSGDLVVIPSSNPFHDLQWLAVYGANMIEGGD